MDIEVNLKNENKKELVLRSLERKMKHYQFLERRLCMVYMMVFILSLSLMITGFLYPIHDLIYHGYNLELRVQHYYGYFLIFASIVLYAFLQNFYSKDKRVEIKILNNNISSMYDDYILGDVSLWELKSGVESVIDHYVKNSKNIFIVYSRY